MRTPLPAEIEVTEEFPGEVRFRLPRRSFKAGGGCLIASVFFLGFGAFNSCFSMPQGFRGGIFQFVPILFFGGIGLLIAGVGLILVLPRDEVVLAGGTLRFRKRLGPFGWSKSMDVDRLSRFSVSALPSNSGPASGTGSGGPWARFATLKAEAERGRPIVVATFQPREILEPLADELSARCEKLRGGRPRTGGGDWVERPHGAPVQLTPMNRPSPLSAPSVISAPMLDGLPNVPARDLSNRPGSSLRFRLSMGMSPLFKIVALALVALFWNGNLSIFVVTAVRQTLLGQPSWPQNLFLGLFVLIGLGIIVALLRQLMISVGLGPTRVELADHPLRAGQSAELLIAQSGRLVHRLNALSVSLVCEEKATYRQGTDTRTETRTAQELAVFSAQEIELPSGEPYEARCRLAIPASAMHSFKAKHNEILWKLVVRGDVPRWPDFKYEFPIDVHPALLEANAR